MTITTNNNVYLSKLLTHSDPTGASLELTFDAQQIDKTNNYQEYKRRRKRTTSFLQSPEQNLRSAPKKVWENVFDFNDKKRIKFEIGETKNKLDADYPEYQNAESENTESQNDEYRTEYQNDNSEDYYYYDNEPRTSGHEQDVAYALTGNDIDMRVRGAHEGGTYEEGTPYMGGSLYKESHDRTESHEGGNSWDPHDKGLHGMGTSDMGVEAGGYVPPYRFRDHYSGYVAESRSDTDPFSGLQSPPSSDVFRVKGHVRKHGTELTSAISVNHRSLGRVSI